MFSRPPASRAIMASLRDVPRPNFSPSTDLGVKWSDDRSAPDAPRPSVCSVPSQSPRWRRQPPITWSSAGSPALQPPIWPSTRMRQTVPASTRRLPQPIDLFAQRHQLLCMRPSTCFGQSVFARGHSDTAPLHPSRRSSHTRFRMSTSRAMTCVCSRTRSANAVRRSTSRKTYWLAIVIKPPSPHLPERTNPACFMCPGAMALKPGILPRQNVALYRTIEPGEANFDGVHAGSRGSAVVEDQLLWTRENRQAGQEAVPDAINSSCPRQLRLSGEQLSPFGP